MTTRELNAAGIRGEALRASYLACRELNASYGKTYFLATRLLPPAKRPFVHALYGFARYADEIVDDVSWDVPRRQRADDLQRWSERMLTDLAKGSSDDVIGRALVDTAQRWSIPVEHFEAFLASMAMDLTADEYATYDDLYQYVYGSAAVIGLQMVPILEPSSPEAYPRAMELGTAFQLANFIRDVGEDLNRGRVYLPLDELMKFDLMREDLERRIVDDRLRALLAFQIDRVRQLEASARPGIELLHPTSRPCIEAARVLYCGIVDAVEDIDYEVFDQRATVSRRRRLAVALPAWIRSLGARATS